MMEKKKVNPAQYQFIQKLLGDWVNEAAMTEEQSNQLLAGFEPVKNFSFIRVLSAIGGLLLGFGVLSFIASNWDLMSRPFKLTVILGFLLAFNGAGYLLRNTYPKTAAAFIYVGALIYGAGIFLIEQMFQFSTSLQSSFLLWAVGLVPLAIIKKDVVLTMSTLILFLIWLFNATFDANQFPWLGCLAVLPFYLLYLQTKSKWVLFATNTFLLIWIFLGALDLEIDGLWVACFFFIIGLVLLYRKEIVYAVHGNLLIGISGLALTIPQIWDLSNKGIEYSFPAIFFAVNFGLYLLYRIRGGSLFAIALICALIVRYYVDLTYDFLPKSVFFIIGGIILLGFGYTFERSRKKGGIQHEL